MPTTRSPRSERHAGSASTRRRLGLRSAAAVGVIALAGVGLVGCHTQSGSADAAKEDTSAQVTLMVGGLDKIIYLPAQLTEDLGYFKDEGLDVKLLTQPSGASAETALLSNQVQGVVGFYDHTVVLQAKGQCLESVVQFANVPGEAEVVSSKSGIKDVAGLKGHHLGITSPGSSTDYLTQYLMKKAGASTNDYSSIAVGAGQTFISSLEQGGDKGIDAGMTTDPTIAQITKTGLGKVLLDMRTTEGTQKALGGLYPASSLYLSCDYVQKNPQKVQKLANAFVKTLNFISSSTPEQVAAKMPSDFKGNDAAAYVSALKDSLPMFTKDGVMDADGAKNVLNVLDFSNPDVKGKASKVDLSKTYTTQFVKAAK